MRKRSDYLLARKLTPETTDDLERSWAAEEGLREEEEEEEADEEEAEEEEAESLPAPGTDGAVRLGLRCLGRGWVG